MSGCPVVPAKATQKSAEAEEVISRILEEHFFCKNLAEAVANCRVQVIKAAPKSDSRYDRFIGQITAAVGMRRTHCEPEVKGLIRCRSEMGAVASRVESDCGVALTPGKLKSFFSDCVVKEKRKSWLWSDPNVVNDVCVEELRKVYGCAAEIRDKTQESLAKPAK